MYSNRNRRAALALLAAVSLAAASRVPAAEKMDFSGDSLSTTLVAGSEHTLLQGHAWVQTTDLRITADQIEVFGKSSQYVQCSGNVHVVDATRGLDITSQELFYDRDQKIARVKGNAVMADVKNEMTVKGGFIEDRDTDKLTIIQIGVRIFKKDIVCRAEFAMYWRDKKILELSGMPWVSKGGDVYQAARITVNVDTEEITLEGGVQGTLEDTTKQQPDASGAPGGQQQPDTGGAGSGN